MYAKLRFPSSDFFFFHSDPFIFIQAQHRYLCYLWEDIGVMTFNIRFTVQDMPHMERMGFVLATFSSISWGALQVAQVLTMKKGRAYNFPASLRADELIAPIPGFCYFVIDLGRTTSQFWDNREELAVFMGSGWWYPWLLNGSQALKSSNLTEVVVEEHEGNQKPAVTAGSGTLLPRRGQTYSIFP